MINIDYSLFLNDFDTFKRCLWPLLEKQMQEAGEPKLSDDQIMDLYLDLYTEYNAGNSGSR